MIDQIIGTEETEKELKPCFIITPIGDSGSETFLKASGLIDSVMRPILAEFNFYALPAYDINAAGSINKQVIERIVQDDLVIANLTGLNPNVMYELAIRHSYKKRIIIMAEKGTKLPFDISDQRTIFYEDSLHGSEEAKPKLNNAIKEVLANEVTSNPIIDAVKEAAVLNTITAGESGDLLKYILERFDRLESSISKKNNQENSAAIFPKDYNFAILNLKFDKNIDVKPGHQELVVFNLAEKTPNLEVSIKLIERSLIVSTIFDSVSNYNTFKRTAIATGLFSEVAEQINNVSKIIYSK